MDGPGTTPGYDALVASVIGRCLMRGIRLAALPVVCGLALTGCADASTDRADVPELVLAALPPIAEDGFGRISDLEIGPDGRVFVLDGLNRTIRVFDADGSLLRSFGQQGQGPGELERPEALAWDPNGHLWVADPGNGRFTVFDAEGGLVGTHLPPDPFVAFPLTMGFSATGRLLVVALDGGSLEGPRVLVEHEVGAEGLREVRRSRLAFIGGPTAFRHEGDGMVLMLEIPFLTFPAMRVGPEGHLWYAETGTPWVHRWSPQGGVEETFGREFAPPPVTRAERDSLLGSEEVEELRRAAGAGAVAGYAALIPETKPHLHGFFHDDAGKLWIMRNDPPPGQGVESPLRMDVYDGAGNLVATAAVRTSPEPERPRPRLRDGLLVGVVRDELGVESVVRYRVGG